MAESFTSACWKGTNSKSTSLEERPIPVSLEVVRVYVDRMITMMLTVFEI